METKNILCVTIAQTEVVWENPGQNRLNLEKEIRPLHGACDLIILPETFTTGFTSSATDLAEPMDGPTINWLINLSAVTRIAIGGSILVKENGQIFNRFVFVQPDGSVSWYDKRHLFSIGGESGPMVPGNQRVIVNYLGWRIGLYICYDLRFPVWCRNLNDTDLMIFTANWPASRSDIWEVLLKARAIENQVYVAGVNRVGTDGHSVYYSGNSQMVTMKGEVLAGIGKTENDWPIYEIYLNELNIFRKAFPVANDADKFVIR